VPEKNLGTAGYMSPEHIQRKPLDARADVFSLGVVLYELLTGMQGGAFRSSDPKERLRATLTRDVPPPSVCNTTLGRAWDRVIERALAKSRDKRYGSMAELERAIEGTSKHLGETALKLAVLIAAIVMLGLASFVVVTGKWDGPWRHFHAEPTVTATLDTLASGKATAQPDDPTVEATSAPSRQPTVTMAPVATSTP